MKYNVIFLDIDGVLNNARCTHEVPQMDEFCVARLAEALNVIPNACVVISSSWKSSKGIDGMYQFMKNNGTYDIFIPIMRFIHPTDYCTPRMSKKRGYEVKYWVDSHQEFINKYICIDDDSDFLPYQPLLQTDRWHGFGYIEMEILKSFFGVFDTKKLIQEDIQSKIEEVKCTIRLQNKRVKLLEKLLIEVTKDE